MLQIYIECDQIFNLAYPASAKLHQKDTILTFKTSDYGFVYCLDFVKRTNARILQRSAVGRLTNTGKAFKLRRSSFRNCLQNGWKKRWILPADKRMSSVLSVVRTIISIPDIQEPRNFCSGVLV